MVRTHGGGGAHHRRRLSTGVNIVHGLVTRVRESRESREPNDSPVS